MSTAYLFPGQGSHAVGMGQPFYEQSPAARAIFTAADELLDFPLSTLCFAGPLEELTDTINQQPALYVTSLAALAVLRENGGDDAVFAAGHSLGELTALVAAGSLSFEDGLRLVRRRGELMKEADQKQPGRMAAVLGLETDIVQACCEQAAAETGQIVVLANDNCPGQVVISGHAAAVERAGEILTGNKARKVVPLPITIAAHSPLMAPAAAAFAAAVEATPFAPPTMPVIANTTAAPLTTPEAIRAELKAQLTGPVRWTESMQLLVAQGVDTVVEVGPGDVLQNLMKRIDRAVNRTQVNPA